MTKKEICLNNKSIAYISALNGIEIKHIEHGIDDYIYAVSGAWGGKKSYHKAKIYYDGAQGSSPYFKINGYRFSFDECIRMK